MITDKKAEAKQLYFQTELSKTQIASLLGMSRRTLHFWIKEGTWDRLKQASDHMPALIAEKCYHLMGHFADSCLSEMRIARPLSNKEADTLHKLAVTINKLKNRTTLNENMEMFACFLDTLKKSDPQAAQAVAPHIEGYIASRAAVSILSLMPANYDMLGRIPVPKEDTEELQLDMQDVNEWYNAGLYQGMERTVAPDVEDAAHPPAISEQPQSQPVTAEEAPVAQLYTAGSDINALPAAVIECSGITAVEAAIAPPSTESTRIAMLPASVPVPVPSVDSFLIPPATATDVSLTPAGENIDNTHFSHAHEDTSTPPAPEQPLPCCAHMGKSEQEMSNELLAFCLQTIDNQPPAITTCQ